mmetsp:Transcript_4527/g.8276  ORF Transcript_4527/g.8276 Transcript_4527/m.8276 type:complete len:131 (+) Transcript_4527:1227-1619(+)
MPRLAVPHGQTPLDNLQVPDSSAAGPGGCDIAVALPECSVRRHVRGLKQETSARYQTTVASHPERLAAAALEQALVWQEVSGIHAQDRLLQSTRAQESIFALDTVRPVPALVEASSELVLKSAGASWTAG